MKAREIDIDEVLPKREGLSAKDDPLIAFISRLMDEQFLIPGTSIRFGLDPILGLLPTLGAPASALVSVALIALSARSGVPPIVLGRMAINVLINTGLDAIPVAGDALSIFFRSNSKNYELHRKYAGTARKADWRDRVFVIAIIGGLIAVLVFSVVLTLGIAIHLVHWLFQK